jgi:hypothetical protein
MVKKAYDVRGGSAMVKRIIISALLVGAPAFAAQMYADVTSQMGVYVAGLGSGAGWADFDGDGDLDLIVSNSSSGMIIYLFRNDGSKFTDVSSSSGITDEARNFAIGDYDNDGRPDVATISFGYKQTRLFRNKGGMQFDDVSSQAGIFGTYGWRCAWVDYDNDGHLDFFQCGSSSNYLFRNKGNGTFEERAAAAGITSGGRSCAWFDYDNDGWQDCYLGASGANLLYRNKKNGTFEEVAAAAGVADANRTSGVCAGDFNADGHFDLYSVNISSPSNKLFKNLGNGKFQDITYSAGVADVGDGRTATFLDIDYDGLVDLFSSNHINPNRLYRNKGNETFVDIASQINIANPMDPFGTAFGDYDGDGDIDVFLATHFGNKLLRCDGVTNRWLVARLVGTTSNKNAVGARARCDFASSCEYAQMDGGHGMGDSDSFDLEFGLGTATNASRVTVWWPSGRTEAWYNLGSNKYVTLTEGTGQVGVELSYFKAAQADGVIALRWATTARYAGFNLYREKVGEANAPRARLNGELVRGRSPYCYVDEDVEAGARYRYWLEAVDAKGRGELAGPVEAAARTAVRALRLIGARPNPARHATTVTFELAAASDVKLEVYDLSGRKILREARAYAAGAAAWELGTSDLSPGIYILRLAAGDATAAGKVAVVK